MCQLYALSSNTPTAVTFSFTGFSARGGHTGEHVDGFGIAFHDARGCRVFIDDAPASRSPLAAFLRRQPIRATTVLAHIRKATQGAVQLENCHPFQRRWRGKRWTFCHNGDLKHFRPALPTPYEPVGHTDSEAAFGWLLHRLDLELGDWHGTAHPAPGWPVLAPLLHGLADELSRHGPFNFLLTDGETVYAHCSTRLHWLQRRHPHGVVQLIDTDLSLDLAAANGPLDRMALVATEPLTRAEPWQAMVPGELVVLQQGAPVWSSRCLQLTEALAA